MSTLAAVVLLFSYRTSLGSAAPGTVATAVATTPVPVPSTSDATGTAKATTTSNATVDGPVTQTQWGPVQVRVTLSGGRITDVTALQYPQGNGRDAEINSYALPVLHDEVLAAQSAHVDAVSGATVTSDGYVTSLQAALDAAHHG
ncbi:MAG TPA: FMN-binding protein [Mycobacteriales bacterium]